MQTENDTPKPENEIQQERRVASISSDLFAAVDVLRGALMDNPCVLAPSDEYGDCQPYYFSDPDLAAAIRTIIPHLP